MLNFRIHKHVQTASTSQKKGPLSKSYGRYFILLKINLTKLLLIYMEPSLLLGKGLS